VLKASAAKNEGLAEFWQSVEAHRSALEAAGELTAKRRHQALAWMWQMIDSGLRARFRDHPGVRATLPQVLNAVEAGTLPPAAAAQQLLGCLSHDYEIPNYD
jgi:LAO/AO transport system kinase